MPLNLSNAYHPLLASVTKIAGVFYLQVDGSWKGGRMCAAIHQTPPNVKDNAFLMSPLVKNK
jgi:hypothetical protein